MDNSKPIQTADALLDDLQSIRELLADGLEPPLLTEQVSVEDIPVLSDIVASAPVGPAPVQTDTAFAIASESELRKTVRQAIGRDNEINRLDTELRAAAQLLLQDVVDEFVPQIESELRRRLQDHLDQLLPPRR